MGRGTSMLRGSLNTRYKKPEKGHLLRVLFVGSLVLATTGQNTAEDGSSFDQAKQFLDCPLQFLHS